MEEQRLEKQLRFLAEADKMKDIYRGTLLVSRARRETDAEHSWHFALMALLLSEYAGGTIDPARVVKMALVHDLVEIYAGDSYAYDPKANEDKEAREQAAADRLFSLLPKDQGPALRALWEEFDRMDTPDSQFAAAVDRLQPFLNSFLTEGDFWKKNGVTSKQVYARMEPIKTGMPQVWPTVDAMIQESIQKGWLSD